MRLWLFTHLFKYLIQTLTYYTITYRIVSDPFANIENVLNLKNSGLQIYLQPISSERRHTAFLQLKLLYKLYCINARSPGVKYKK